MSYRYALSPRAERYFARLDRPTQRRVADRLDELAADPFDPSIAFRILYQVQESDDLIRIEDIGPRGQIYRDR